MESSKLSWVWCLAGVTRHLEICTVSNRRNFCKICKCHARFKGRVKLYLSGANQNT